MRFSLFFLLALASSCTDSHVDSDAGVDSAIDAGSSECEHGTDCRLVSVSCCGSCGTYSRNDIVSVHKDDVSAHFQNACGDEFTCPACAAQPNPNFVATCVARKCDYFELGDLGEGGALSDFAKCADARDCTIRYSGCCECGATITAQNSVAVRRDKVGEYQALICEPEQSCDDCVGDYGALAASCSPAGACAVDSPVF